MQANATTLSPSCPDRRRRSLRRLTGCLCLLWLLASLPVAAQLPSPVPSAGDQAKEENANGLWQPPNLLQLPTDWWNQFETVSPQIANERLRRFIQNIEDRSKGLGADDLVVAQNDISNLRNLTDLLLVAEQTQSPDKFAPIPSRDSYTLKEILDLRSQWRDMQKIQASINLQIDQSESQVKLIEERRDKLLRQYNAASLESPARILSGINRVSARVELKLTNTRENNLRDRLARVKQQSQALQEQQLYARNHLAEGKNVDLSAADAEVEKAHQAVVSAREKVSALQPQLLEVLSASKLNTSLEILRKQQLTRASAAAELAQVQEALAQTEDNWLRLRAGELDYSFDFNGAGARAQRLTEEALKQVDLWSSISQAALVSTPPGNDLNTVKNFEIAQSVARETLELSDQIRSACDDLLLAQDIFFAELVGSQSGFRRAWSRLVLAVSDVWHPLIRLADFTLFDIGETPVTIGGIIKMLLILVFAFAVSWLFRYLLSRGLGSERISHSPAIYTLGRLLHYIIILVGTFAALGSIGIDFTSFALIAGALSVGIGFGLQAIVNNFVSGLILLFEGTLRVGDHIELDSGLAGAVREINTRATIVNTTDGVDVVVPNSELVTTKLTNWTLRESVARMRIPFGVAYGSDKELVKKVALEAATEIDFVLLHMPGREPSLRLVKFGESALDFELMVWVSRSGVRRPQRVRASFLWALETRLREAGIEIPFPQRDIHVRSDFRVPSDSPAPKPESNPEKEQSEEK